MGFLLEREASLDALRDRVRSYAETLTEEHRDRMRQYWKGDDFLRFTVRVDDSSWGFKLGWFKLSLSWASEAKRTTFTEYLRQNNDGTYDKRKFKRMTQEEWELMEEYEPRYVDVRVLMKKLTLARHSANALKAHVEKCEWLKD